eukprot:gene25376-31830_t
MSTSAFALGRHKDNSSVGKSLAPGQSTLDVVEEIDPVNPSDPSQAFINIDAAEYQKHLELAMNFHTSDETASKYDIAYAKAAQRDTNSNSFDDEAAEGGESESEDEAEDDETPDSRASDFAANSQATRQVPKMALVNGHFRGATPVELSRLTRKGSHWGSTATVFSVLNDVNAIAEHLPRIPSLKDIALIRSAVDSTSPRDFLYSPYNVTQALMWLAENNPLWEGKFTRPEGALWTSPGSRETQEIECIFAEDEDYEGLDPDLNGSSGADGHAVNPNAPPSNMTDVLLTGGSHGTQDLLQQVEHIVTKQRSVMTRANGEFLRDYETERFLQLAFVNLFPYGRGGPEPNGSFGISSKNGEEDLNPVNITVAQAREFLEHVERNRTQSRGVTTTVNNQYQVPENLINEAMLQAQPDMYLAELYDNAVTSSRSCALRLPWHAPLAARRENSDKLNKKERVEMLRDHPLLSARLHAAQQTVFWTYVIHGKHKPFGKVLDFWRRVEFQEKGTPHSHNLINIATIEGDDPELQSYMLSKEEDYQYKFERASVLDATQPCRERFDAVGRDFSFDAATSKIKDRKVRRLYRRLQLCNQMHTCRLSCYKYCKRSDPHICRYEFPKQKRLHNENDSVFIKAKDRRGRFRLRIDPPRNNANINVCAASPLVFLGSRGNQDVQYLATKSGGAEYVSKYASKTETAECKVLLNAVNRKLAGVILRLEEGAALSLRTKLRSVAMAMLTSHQIGSVYYRAMRKAAVISLGPHIPLIESSERACFAILLFHTKWDQGEAGLVPPGETAQSRYHYLKSLDSEHEDSLPPYVMRSVSKRMESDAFLADTGNADFASTATVEQFSELLADEQEELDSPQQLPQAQNLLDSITPDHQTPQFDRILSNCPLNHLSFLHQFIPNMKLARKDGHISYNQCTEEELQLKAASATAIVPIRDVDSARDELDASVATLNKEQLLAYQVATHHISGAHGGQMFMFLSGEGGTGKSRLINDVTKYTQILYGKTAGYFGSVLKTAPTGGAAFNIKGSTWHSALGKSSLGKHTQKSKLTDRAISNLQKNLNGTVLFILDEISLLSAEDLSEISFRLCTATGNFKKPFGGLHTILAGDFYQMKTISGTSIVDRNPKTPEGRDGRSIWLKLTHFAQLTINVRAQSSNGVLSPLAEFTKRVRVGDVGPGVLEPMNERVVNSIEVAMRLAHPQAVWISATHKRIKYINDEFLKKMVSEGQKVTRLIAVHHASKLSIPRPTRAIRNLLYSIAGASSSRSGPGPQTDAERMPTNFGDLEDHERELPIVLVQMDGYDDPVNMSHYRELNVSNRYTSSRHYKLNTSQASRNTG